MPFAVLREQFSSGIQMRVFANTGENIEDFAPVRLGVLHPVCSQNGQSICARQIDKLSIDAFLSAKEMPLNFNEHIFAPENIDQKLGAVCDTLGSARVSRAGDASASRRNVFRAIQRSIDFAFRKVRVRQDAEHQHARRVRYPEMRPILPQIPAAHPSALRTFLSRCADALE